MKEIHKLHNWQQPISDFAFSRALTIIALCPGGGKTEIAIAIIIRFLNENPTKRILILTHGTNTLLRNFIDRLNKYSLEFDDYTDDLNDVTKRIHICLPNQEKKIKGKYHLIIVDEAHELYLAERMQRIIQKINPDMQVLLTGTPSKFISDSKFNGVYSDENKEGGIFVLAANQLPVNYFPRLGFEIVETKYNWYKFYSSKMELPRTTKITLDQTNLALENIFQKLLIRLKNELTPAEFNSIKLAPSIKGKLKQLKSWAGVYNKLGKTIIYCFRTSQANDIQKILKKHGVEALVSHGKNDKDDINIIKFTDKVFKNGIINEDYQKHNVLIVVGRAKLGYSNSDLMNIIDMSGTHNPDSIYQMFARLLRKDNGTNPQKYYLKVTTQEYGMRDYTHACMCAALMLTDYKYLSTFNGKNFKGIMIPVIKQSRIPNTTSIDDKNRPKDKVNRPSFVLPEFSNDVIKQLVNYLEVDSRKQTQIVGWASLGEVRDKLMGVESRFLWTSEKRLAAILGIDY